MGHSTELMLVHLSEKWRRAIDENKVGIQQMLMTRVMNFEYLLAI